MKHDEAFYTIIEAKYARIISEISDMHDISLEDAMRLFYQSETMRLVEQGVADLHCRSEKYLGDEVWRETH